MNVTHGSRINATEVTRANTLVWTLAAVFSLGFAMAIGHAVAVWNVANDCKRLTAFHVGSTVFDCRQR